MLKRYYTENSSVNPDIPQAFTCTLMVQLHAMYTHWIFSGGFPKDFSSCLRHVSDILMFEHLWHGSPSLEEPSPELVVPTMELCPYKDPATLTTFRFYDEDGGLHHRSNTDFYREKLLPFFLHWGQMGYVLRDFTALVSDSATAVIYDHELCESLGGLGGGKTGKEFLTTRYYRGKPLESVSA